VIASFTVKGCGKEFNRLFQIAALFAYIWSDLSSPYLKLRRVHVERVIIFKNKLLAGYLEQQFVLKIYAGN
jgi:hypothetical protein